MSLCASWLRNVEFGEEGTEKVSFQQCEAGPNASRKQSAQDWHTRRSTELLVDLEHADVRLEAALVGVVPLVESAGERNVDDRVRVLVV